jgi:hypothetical protein
MRDRLPPPALRPAPDPVVPRLALRAADAALALSVSERFLREITDLPRIRVGNAVLFRVTGLEAWLRDHESHDADATQPADPSPAAE